MNSTNYQVTQQPSTGPSVGAPQSPIQTSTIGTSELHGEATPSAHHEPNAEARTSVPDDTQSSSATAYGKAAGESVYGIFRWIRGIGESIRGNILGAVDAAFGNQEGIAKNEEIVRKGREMRGESQAVHTS